MKIPTELPINTPEQIEPTILGNQIEMVKTLDKDNIKDKDRFKEKENKIWKEREERGVGNLYSEIQPRGRPKINQDFIAKQIDMLFIFDILDAVGDEPDQGLRWCQGKVTGGFHGKR